MHIIHIPTRTYPLTAAQVVADSPATIFPIPFALPDGYAWVAESHQPEHDPATHQVLLANPELVGDQWHQRWHVEPLTAGEIAARAAAAAAALTDAQQAARARIGAWRDAQEQGGILFEHDGHAWDGGLVVRTRLQPLLSLPEVPEGFFWTDADNQDVPVSLTQLQALNQAHELALITRGFQIHVRQRAMKAEVDALATPAACAAYVPGLA